MNFATLKKGKNKLKLLIVSDFSMNFNFAGENVPEGGKKKDVTQL